jgi:hypothetical protein
VRDVVTTVTLIASVHADAVKRQRTCAPFGMPPVASTIRDPGLAQRVLPSGFQLRSIPDLLTFEVCLVFVGPEPWTASAGGQ